VSQAVCYIIETERGFKPAVAVAYESEGDNDSFLAVIATVPSVETLEEAQEFVILNLPEGTIAYLNPVRFCDPQMPWLSEILAVNPA
jgi:hypothetical protein